MRVAWVVILLVGCKGGETREAQCTRARDRLVPLQEELVQKTLDSVDSVMAARLRGEADREMAAFKANFVAACVRAKSLDFKCLEKLEDNSKECRQQLRPLWDEVYRDVNEPPKDEPPKPATTSTEVTPMAPTPDCALGRKRFLERAERTGEPADRIAKIKSHFLVFCAKENISPECFVDAPPADLAKDCELKLMIFDSMK